MQFKIYPDIDSTVGEDTPVPAEIESEQEWLTSLYGFITQGHCVCMYVCM
jgi:hypothetical protein